MKKYICETCGYVYDPEVGDPDTRPAVTCMTQKLAIPIAVSLQAQPLKTFPKIGFVPSAE